MEVNPISAVENAEEEVMATCKKCHISKRLYKDYYRSLNKIHSSCKKCMVRDNVAYQRRKKVWLYRFVDGDKTRSYAREYYAKNKDKFKVYRKTYALKHPEYHKMAMRRKKEKDPK